MMQIEIPITQTQMLCDEDDDLNALCRLCAHSSDLLVPIYEGEGLKTQLADKIASYLPVQIRQTDSLPIHLCYKCATLVLSWHELVTGCVEADRRLRILCQSHINGVHKQHPVDKHKGIEMSVESNIEAVDKDRPGPSGDHLKDTSHTDCGNIKPQESVVSSHMQRPPPPPGQERPERGSKVSLKEYIKGRQSVSSSEEGPNCHKCFYCQEVLQSRSLLNKHLASAHADEGFHCIHCDNFFPVDKETFEVHVLSHSVKIESDYVPNAPSLSSSDDSDSSGEEYVPTKQKRAPERVSRTRHREDAPKCPKKLFSCRTCSKTFKRSIDLRDHERDDHPQIKEEPSEGDWEAIGQEGQSKEDEGKSSESGKRTRDPSPSSDPELPFRCPCKRKFKSKRALHIHRASKRCPFRIAAEKKKEEQEVLPPRRRTAVIRPPADEDESSEESCDDSSDDDFAKKPRAGTSKDKEKPLYKCETCNRHFKLKESYNTHVRIHTGEKPFTCHVCGKQFSHSGGLSYHLRHVHFGIKDHKCEFCGRCFALKAALGDHRRIHTGERPYVCEVCGKDFKSKASLYIHSKIHTDSFPHPCKYCNRRFRWRQQLLGHLTTHTGEKKHYCSTCGKGFGVKNDLTRHERIHSDAKPFSCTLCGVSFGQKRYLKNHIKSRHEARRQQNVPAPPPIGPPPPQSLPPAMPHPVPLPHHLHVHHPPPPPHLLPPTHHHHHHLHPHFSHHLPHLQ